VPVTDILRHNTSEAASMLPVQRFDRGLPVPAVRPRCPRR